MKKYIIAGIAMLFGASFSYADWVVHVVNNTEGPKQVGLSRYNSGCSGASSGIFLSATNVAVGATHTFVVSDSYYNTYLSGGDCVYAYRTSPNVFTTPAPLISNPTTLYLGGGAPPAETNCFYQFPLHNNNASIQTFYAAKNLVLDMSKTLVLGPGRSGVLSFNAPCAESNQWSILWAPWGEPENVDVTAEITPVDTTAPTNLAPAVVEKPAPTVYDPLSPVNGGGTNGPILFTGTNDTREGYSAIYNAIVQSAAQNDENLKNLQWPGDYPDAGTHARLDTIIGIMTNNPSASTNDNSAAASEAATSGQGALHSLTSGVPGSITIDTEALGSGWTIGADLAGGESVNFNLNPFTYAWVSDVAALVRRLVTWALYAGFLFYSAKVLHEAMRSMSRVNQGSSASVVPGLSAGSALLMAGIIVAAITVVILLGAGFLATKLTNFYTQPLTGVGTTAVRQALYMADQFLPLALFFTITFLTFTFRWLVAGAEWLANAIIKFSVG